VTGPAPRPKGPPGPSGPDAEAGGERPPRFGRRAALALVAAFLVGGALYTMPLVAHLADGLPFAAVPPEGRETAWRIQGDYLQFYYYLWLGRDRFLTGASPLRDPYQFAVDGPRPNLPNTFLPFALLYLPLSVAGPLLAYNLLVLASFPLAALAAALAAHRYGASRAAAVVAGTVFACMPYRVGALLGGHPAGLAYFLAPLALWGLEGAIAGSVAGGAWCAAALVSLAIVEPHFFYFAAIGLPLYGIARVGLVGWRREALSIGTAGWCLAAVVALAPAWGAMAVLGRQGWEAPVAARIGIGLVVALGILALWQCTAGWLRAAGVTADGRDAAWQSLRGWLPAVAAAGAGTRIGARLALVGLALPLALHAAWVLRAWRSGWARRVHWEPLGVVAVGAAGGAAFLLFLRHALLTRSVSGAGRTLHEVLLFSPEPLDLLTRVNPSAGRAVYPGVLALVFAAIGSVALVRRPPDDGRRRIALVFIPVVVLGAALSLGLRLPAFPLFEAAFRLVPFWNFVRQPAKLQLLVALGLAVLAGLGVHALGRRLGRATWPIAILLAILVAAEYHPWRPTGVSRLPTGGPGYAAIREAGPRALYIPFWPGDSSYSALYLYGTTLTRVPMLNGYSAWLDRSYVTDIYRALEVVNLGVVGEAEYGTLKRYGVRQVVLDRDAFPLKVSPFGPAFTQASLRSSRFLEPVPIGVDGETHRVFRVRDRPGDGAPALPRSALGIYWEAESLARETGRITDDADASNGRVVLGRAGRDRPGFLTFGPYRLLPPGPFRAVFRVRGDGSRVELQVTGGGGRRVLGSRELPLADGATFVDVPVSFEMLAAAPVEYRVKWDGAGWAAADAVAVAFADVPDPAPEFEVEALGHELRERADPAASGGLAGQAEPARTPRDAVWDGPLRAYPAGRYRLWLRLKLPAPTVSPIVWCGIRPASRGPMLGERELTGRDIPEAGRYVEVDVPFSLTRPTVLEFPCLYRGAVEVWLDRLRVERLSP
jgi:hypothetical protein